MTSINRQSWAFLVMAIGCSTACVVSPKERDDGASASARALDAVSGGATAVSTSAACDLTKPFDAPVLVAGFDERDIFSFRPSADELSATLSIQQEASGPDLFVASRATNADAFVIGAPITELNTPSAEYWPTLSADGEMIFFESARPLEPGGPTNEGARIWAATRPNAGATFGPATVLGIFREATAPETSPYLHASGRSLYFASLARGGAGNLDLFIADITDFGVVTAVRNITSANSTGEENMPIVSNDERALFFSRWAGSGRDVWVVGRSSTAERFGVAQEVVEVSSTYDDFPTGISTDACRLYFISNRPVAGIERYRVWMAEKPL